MYSSFKIYLNELTVLDASFQNARMRNKTIASAYYRIQLFLRDATSLRRLHVEEEILLRIMRIT